MPARPPCLTLSSRLKASAFVWLLFFAALPALSAKGIGLAPVSKTVLKKTSGRVDQLIPVSDDGFLVRDSDYQHEETQALELYDSDGYYCGRFGRFGRSPGEYYRLKSVAVAGDETVWVADVTGRLSRFNMAGWLLSTKLIQNPGYQIDGLALDESHDAFYLSGCLPKQVYINYGCRLVHRYGMADEAYRQSFLETDSQVLEKNLLSLEDHLLDIDERGRLYAADAPVLQVSMLKPESGEARVFPIKSKLATPPEAVPRGLKNAADAYQNAFLVDQLLASGRYVVVSIRQPHEQGFLLQIFNDEGQPLAVDLDSPGRLVGKTRDGHFYFATKTADGFEITEYEISGKNSQKKPVR